MTDGNKMRTEKRVMRLSFLGSVIFMIVEGIMAYLTHSHSILMDFVFDITDLIMIGPFLFLVPLLYKPVTEKRPYGFAQVESLFLIIKYSVLFLVTLQLAIGSVKSILHGGEEVDAGAIAIFEFLVFLGCLIFYLILSYFSRKYESDTIRAELYIWKLDVISSIGVAGAFLTQLCLQKTKGAFIAPYIDPVVAIVMSILLIQEPIRMIHTGLKELVLFAPDKEVMAKIRMVAQSQIEKTSYSIKFLDVIQTGRKTWVEIYIQSKNEKFVSKDLQTVRNEIRKELKNKFDQIYIELIPDIPD